MGLQSRVRVRVRVRLIPEVRGGDLTGNLFIEWFRVCLPRILAWSLTADEISAALAVVVGALWPWGSWADERSAGAFALCTAAAATAGLQAVFASSSCSLFSCRSCSCGDADSQKNAAIFASCASSRLGAGLRFGKGDRLPTAPAALFVLRRASCPRQLACSVAAAFEVLIPTLAPVARVLRAKDMRRSFRLSARLARNDRTMLIGLAGRSFRGDDTMSRECSDAMRAYGELRVFVATVARGEARADAVIGSRCSCRSPCRGVGTPVHRSKAGGTA